LFMGHQHGDDDVTWKPRITIKQILYEWQKWQQSCSCAQLYFDVTITIHCDWMSSVGKQWEATSVLWRIVPHVCQLPTPMKSTLFYELYAVVRREIHGVTQTWDYEVFYVLFIFCNLRNIKLFFCHKIF
jgi:hypothetical protein